MDKTVLITTNLIERTVLLIDNLSRERDNRNPITQNRIKSVLDEFSLIMSKKMEE